MLKLLVGNVHTTIEGVLHPLPAKAHEIHEALRLALSYEVVGAEWSAKYKEGNWDGRISLYHRRFQRFPAGLTGRAVKLFEELEIPCKLVDTREKPPKDYPLTYDFGNRSPRFYQEEIAAVVGRKQRGVVAAATGAGKTMASCLILATLQVKPVVFIVPAIELLRQTQKEFEKYLRLNGRPVTVGMAGGGACKINLEGVNVITYQTALAAFDERYQERGNKIIQDEHAGDGSKKSTEQLQLEYEAALKDYRKAARSSKAKLDGTQNSLAEMQSDLEQLRVQPAPEKPVDRRAHNALLKKLETALGKAERQYEKDLAALVKPQQAVLTKAKAALESREKALADKAAVRALFEQCRAMIVDEAHVAAVVIEALGGHAKQAYFRLGLSATPWREDNQEIRIEGTLGKQVYEISASDLIDMGFLVPPRIFMPRIHHVENADTYQDIYDKHVVHCWERNCRIKQFAETFKEAGRPVLILVERREHGQILESMIKDAVFVPGGDKGEDDPTDEERNYRRRMLNAVERNEIVLIATQWANVGVDAPAISTLILAGSGQSSVTTYQQAGRVLRCLGRNAEESTQNGKAEAVIIDFMDSQKTLRQHSLRRKNVYKGERSFSLKMVS